MSHNDCNGKSGYQDSSPAMATRKHAFWVISFDKIWGLKSRHIAVNWAVSPIQLMKVHNMRHTNHILWLRFVSTECIGWAKVLHVLTSPNNCSTRTQYFAWLINVRWSYSLLGSNVIIWSSHEKQPQSDIRRLDLVDSRDIWRGLNQLGSSYSHDHLIFIMRVPTMVRWHLYTCIETALCFWPRSCITPLYRTSHKTRNTEPLFTKHAF